MLYDANRKIRIQQTLRGTGWEQNRIKKESPALERVVDDLEGVEPQRYSKRNPPPPDSYLGSVTSSGTANALLDNLSQRVMGELKDSPVIGKQTPLAVAKALAIAADSIKENRSIWEGFGFMDKFYDEADVIENRYAEAAKMVKLFANSHPEMPFDSMFNPDVFEKNKDQDEEFNEAADFSEWMDMFKDWMNRLEPYFQLISQEIDRVIAAPTSRIKHLKHFTPDGDKTDIDELDLSRFSQITSDSLALLASDQKLAALMLDDLTMYEQYTEEHRKYIDVFVVDQSGSMAGDKILKAAAFLYSRLQKVIDGYAMCAIVEFDTRARMYKVPLKMAEDKPDWMIDTPEKARYAQAEVIKQYSQFAGGGTDIPAGVRKGIELAREMEKLGGILPNITIVTDEDTSISNMTPESCEIPVNGLAVYGNTYLQNFCIATKGGYNNLEVIDLTLMGLGEYS